MKKIFTLIAAAFCITTTAEAQTARNLDFSGNMISTTPSIVGIGEDVTVKGFAKYVGTTPTKATDTVVYALAYNNSLLSIGGGVWFYRQNALKVLNTNDTIQFSRVFNWTSYPESRADSTKNMCMVVDVINRSADSSTDNNFANNAGCTPLTRRAIFPTDVQLVNLDAVQVYPNPAKNVAFINIPSGATSGVVVRVYDIAGRVVIEEKHAVSSASTIRLNTEKLQNGLYMYNVTIGNKVETGKLTIAK